MTDIAIIDCGISNVGSVRNALNFLISVHGSPERRKTTAAVTLSCLATEVFLPVWHAKASGE